MKGRPLIWLAVVLSAAIVIGLLYRDETLEKDRSGMQSLVPAVDCDPQQRPCLAGDRQRGLALSFPESVPLMAPFPIEVQVFGALASAVTIDFQMRGMDMGINRIQLQESEPGLWRGRATLPICTSGRADWLVLVDVETESGTSRATFGFSAGAH